MRPRGMMLSGLFIVKPNMLIISDPLLYKGIIPTTSNMKCVLYQLCAGLPSERSLIIVGSLLYERLAT